MPGKVTLGSSLVASLCDFLVQYRLFAFAGFAFGFAFPLSLLSYSEMRAYIQDGILSCTNVHALLKGREYIITFLSPLNMYLRGVAPYEPLPFSSAFFNSCYCSDGVGATCRGQVDPSRPSPFGFHGNILTITNGQATKRSRHISIKQKIGQTVKRREINKKCHTSL
jgi:hypothetical protein